MTTTNGTSLDATRRQTQEARRQAKLLEAEIRLANLKRARARQKQTHELRESMEAWEWINGFNDVVDRLRGPDRDLVLPVSTAQDRLYGWNWPFWRTWLEHARLRAAARLIHTLSGLATGVLKGLASYVVGSGMTFDAGCRKGISGAAKADQLLLGAVQQFLDDFCEVNEFGRRQREIFICSRRDGEHFTRRFVDEQGMTRLRTVLPEQVIEPPAYEPHVYSFGIRNHPEDLEDTEAFWVAYDGMAGHGEEVPADEVDFIKVNVDAPVKRGLTDFCFDTYELLKAAGRMVGNMAEGGAVQAAIAFIRQHRVADQTQVEGFSSAISDYQKTNPRNLQQQNVVQSYPGMVLDIDGNQEYVVPPFANNASGFVEVIQAALRVVAVRWNAPEWLASGDASNNNYASSLTAESPFVKTCQAEQAVYKEHFLRTVRKALRDWCKRGRLRAGGRVWSWDEVRRMVEVQCEAPSIETRNKLEEAQTNTTYIQAQVKSVQTVQQELGLDVDQELANQEELHDRLGQPGQPLPDEAGPDQQQPGGGLAAALGGGGAGLGESRLWESWLREAGFTGIDAHGHKWANGKQVARGEDDTLGRRTEPPGGPELARTQHTDDGPGNVIEPKATSRAQKILAAAGKLSAAGKKKVAAVRQKIAEKFGQLEERYGRKGAIAIMGATVALAPVPVPGTMFAPLAVAEGVLRLSQLLKGKAVPAAEAQEQEIDDATMQREAQALLAAAFAASGEKMPQLEESDFDAADHPRGQPGNAGQFGPGGGGGGKSAGGFGDHKAAGEWAAKNVSLSSPPTPEEKKATARYAGQGYKAINGALRAGKEPAGADKQHVVALDALIARSEVREDVTVQRGVNFAGALKSMKGLVGQEITDKGYVSTTLDGKTAGRFAHTGTATEPVLVTIHVPKGSKALYATQAGASEKKESELILPRGSRFRVESFESGYPGTVRMTYLGPAEPAKESVAESAPPEGPGAGDRYVWGEGDFTVTGED